MEIYTLTAHFTEQLKNTHKLQAICCTTTKQYKINSEKRCLKESKQAGLYALSQMCKLTDMIQEGYEFLFYFFVQIRDSVLQKKINEGTLMNQMKKISENIQLC